MLAVFLSLSPAWSAAFGPPAGALPAVDGFLNLEMVPECARVLRARPLCFGLTNFVPRGQYITHGHQPKVLETSWPSMPHPKRMYAASLHPFLPSPATITSPIMCLEEHFVSKIATLWPLVLLFPRITLHPFRSWARLHYRAYRTDAPSCIRFCRLIVRAHHLKWPGEPKSGFDSSVPAAAEAEEPTALSAANADAKGAGSMSIEPAPECSDAAGGSDTPSGGSDSVRRRTRDGGSGRRKEEDPGR